ncbi:MAG: hypothetical protein IPH31_02225 [Lewinellaceae bacterium]|nr:hypothetical protein [Lewinellaceae bacterium]
MKLLIPFLLPALFLFSCGKTDKNAGTPSGAPPAKGAALSVTSVEGFVAKPSVLTERVTASGNLLPAEETELHPESFGTCGAPQSARRTPGAQGRFAPENL